jgi:hypothetical protein
MPPEGPSERKRGRGSFERVLDAGFRVRALGFRVQGFQLRVRR